MLEKPELLVLDRRPIADSRDHYWLETCMIIQRCPDHRQPRPLFLDKKGCDRHAGFDQAFRLDRYVEQLL